VPVRLVPWWNRGIRGIVLQSLAAHGDGRMNNYWAFLPMTPANDLLAEPDALRRRLAEEGYLYLRQALDQDLLLELRRQILEICADKGWVRGGRALMRAETIGKPVREGDARFFEVYDEVQKLEAFHSLAHDEGLLGIMRCALGETAFPHPLKIARLIFPENYEVTTPPHQDYPNNQGTTQLTASWIPLQDCPMELGGLAILRGSNQFGIVPLRFHLGAGNRASIIPPEMQELHWVTTDFALGDVVLFPSLTIHASLHNASEFFMRLSVDFRYQLEGEALTEVCLEPHFQRLTWEQIYAGWKSDRWKYAWKKKRYELVPYDRSSFDVSDLAKTDVFEYFSWQRRLQRRMQRRLHGS
jgi:ectoine hydroxylase-related dioxygenase (phytanoyl-CoA dioxygenase family)